MALRPLPQSWSSPPPATIAHQNGTLQWHPAMAPRPLHPAMAPWCHVQLEVRTPIGSKNPCSYRYLGKNRNVAQTGSKISKPRLICSHEKGTWKCNRRPTQPDNKVLWRQIPWTSWSSRLTWVGVSSSFTLFAGRNIWCVCSCFPKFSLHIMAMVSAIFLGRTSKKERSLPNLCMWDLAVRLAKSLPTYRKGNSTHRLLPNRLLGKNLLEQTVWEIGLDASNRWAIGNEFMAVIQYENLCCSGKKTACDTTTHYWTNFSLPSSNGSNRHDSDETCKRIRCSLLQLPGDSTKRLS